MSHQVQSQHLRELRATKRDVMSALLHGTNAFLEGQERLVDGRTFRMHTRVAASRLHRVRRPLAPRQVHKSDLALWGKVSGGAPW